MGFFDFLRDTYTKEQVIPLCKNDKRILSDEMVSKARALSPKTIKFRWSMETEGTCRSEEVSDGIYRVTINGSIYGEDDFGTLTNRFNYTKIIYMDKFGERNPAYGTDSVNVTKC
jgi:hypothetical protein